MYSLTSTTVTSNNNGVSAESEASENGSNNGNGGSLTPVLGPEATPRGRLSHGHVKSASISAGSGNTQSTITNRETVASASAADRDSQRWSGSVQFKFLLCTLRT